MKNILLFVFVLCSLSVQGQTIDEFFLNTPDSILPYFKKNARELLLRFTDEKSDTLSSQPNELGGKVWLSHKSEKLIVIHTSPLSDMSFSLIPAENDTLFCFIKTEHAPEPESFVYIYNKVWELQQSVNIGEYARIEFPDTLSEADRNELSSMIEMKICSAEILPEAPETLVVCQNLPTLSAEEKERFNGCKMRINVKMGDVLQKYLK